jgi:hypothetical protein
VVEEHLVDRQTSDITFKLMKIPEEETHAAADVKSRDSFGMS